MSGSDDRSARVALGRAIEVQRVHLGLKRKDLAARAELSYPYISELEKGGKEPSARALRQIAEALQMSVAELVALGDRYLDDPDAELTPVPVSGTDRASSPTGLPAPDPIALESDIAEIVREVVRSELARFERERLPELVALELQRALAGALRPPSES